MKNTMAKITCATLALLFAVLSPNTAHAQAETAPDSYKADNMARIEALSAKTDFEGHFSLKYKVQCHMHKMEPGDYTVVVKTLDDGMKLVMFRREGSEVVVESKPIPPTTVTDQGHSAILVRHGQGPGNYTLEAVYVESLKLVLMLDESGHTQLLDKMFATVKRVPIS
ncbi:MAG: hypothetical protein ABSB66_17275 [Candidatus Acidiferrales bacterium]|jgi:hypothetical protein